MKAEEIKAITSAQNRITRQAFCSSGQHFVPKELMRKSVTGRRQLCAACLERLMERSGKPK